MGAFTYMVWVMFYLDVWKTKAYKSLERDNKEDPGLLHPFLCRHLLGPLKVQGFPINVCSEPHIHCSRQLSQCRAEQLCGMQDALESLLQSIQLHGFQMDSEPGENISGPDTQNECLWERSD